MKQYRSSFFFVGWLILSLIIVPYTAAQQSEEIDPWTIMVDNPLQGDYYGITSANGQIGILSSRTPLEVDKVVVGGLYDACGNSGIPSFFPNINPLALELKVDGDRCTRRNITNYHQSFCFKDGSFTGEFEYQDKIHVCYTIRALYQTPFGFMTDVLITPMQSCQLRVTNIHNVPENLLHPETLFSHIDNKSNPHNHQGWPHYALMTTMANSPTERYRLAATTSFLFPDNPNLRLATEVRHRNNQSLNAQSMEFDQSLNPGQTFHFALVGNIIGSNVVPDVRNEAQRLTVFQLAEGYDRLLYRHQQAWNNLWQSDILVEGDAQAQQDIHSMLYHLYAFNREGSGLNCSPMGLSGLGYCGHSFWDSETWMFPAILVLHPSIAKEMLEYRYQRLPQAQRKAYMMGFNGAMFPWQSGADGNEETAPHNMYPHAENHISGDVAIACWQYYQLTRDKDWLMEKGWPILSLTADFWTSRVDWDESGNAHIINVIGADEWSCNADGGKQIDDNAYTIGVARTNLDYAARAAKVLGKKAKPEWAQTRKALHYHYLDNGVIAENATYHGEVIKQADVSLLAFPLHEVTDPNLIRLNLEYYIEKVPEKQTPAMSKSIYATLYSRLGDYDKALYYFRDSYLPNLNPPFRVIAEFNGGTNPYFITGAGGSLQSLLFGFAGLDITDKGLVQVHKGNLPTGWTKLTLRRSGYPDLVIQ